MKKIITNVILVLFTLISHSQCLPSASYQPDSALKQEGVYYHKKHCAYYNQPGNHNISKICYYDGNIYFNKPYNLIGIIYTKDKYTETLGGQIAFYNIYGAFSNYSITYNYALPDIVCEPNILYLISFPGELAYYKYNKNIFKVGYVINLYNKNELSIIAIPTVDIIEEYILASFITNKPDIKHTKYTNAPELQVGICYKQIGINYGYTLNKYSTMGIYYKF